jgi:hypothetical protein
MCAKRLDKANSRFYIAEHIILGILMNGQNGSLVTLQTARHTVIRMKDRRECCAGYPQSSITWEKQTIQSSGFIL